MKIPSIAHIIYSGPGGTADYVFNLVKGDVDREYQHAIIFFGVEYTPDPLFQTARKVTDKLEIIQKAPGFDADAYASLRGYLRSLGPKAVTLHVNSLIQPISSRMPDNCKLIYVEHQANHLKSRKELLWSALAQRRADYVVCLTKTYQETLRKKLRFLFKSDKNKVIPTGIDLSKYSNTRDWSGNVKLGMVSRINSFRDHETLLTAFVELPHPKAEMHIIGEGPELDNLRTKFNHPRIYFHGLLSASDVAAFLQDIDIYVHASLGETSSLAIMQAQASGLPIIASDVPGLNNILNNKNGILVAPKNAVALKSAIEELIVNHERRQELGQASFDYARKNCSHLEMTKAFLKLVE